MSWLYTLCNPLASPSRKKGGEEDCWVMGGELAPTLGCAWPGRNNGDPGLCSGSRQSGGRAGGLSKRTSL